MKKPILIIFVVESEKRNQSDNRYIGKLLEKRYDFSQNDVTIRYVNMGGKCNYKKSSVISQIKKIVNIDRKIENHVIYCFDTDKIDSNYDEKTRFEEELEYCSTNNYSLIWFNYNIEYVLLGCDVEKNKKNNEAIKFLKNNKSNNIDEKKLLENNYNKKGYSNFYAVLDKLLTKKLPQ